MSTNNPISPKTVAATAGAGLGAAVSSLIIWLLGVTLWGQPATANTVDAAVAAVPSPVSGLVLLIVTAASAGLSGYKVTDPLRLTQTEMAAYRQNRAR